jgi:hypothetical protein
MPRTIKFLKRYLGPSNPIRLDFVSRPNELLRSAVVFVSSAAHTCRLSAARFVRARIGSGLKDGVALDRAYDGGTFAAALVMRASWHRKGNCPLTTALLG